MSTAVTTSVNSWRRISRTERVHVYKRGRTCAHDGCATILSIYNPAKYCAAHLQEAAARRRRAALAVREVPCENCGTPFMTANPRRRYCSDRCRMAAFARRRRAQNRAEARSTRAQLNEAVASVDGTAEWAGPPDQELVESAA
jgi:hypothetical protein